MGDANCFFVEIETEDGKSFRGYFSFGGYNLYVEEGIGKEIFFNGQKFSPSKYADVNPVILEDTSTIFSKYLYEMIYNQEITVYSDLISFKYTDELWGKRQNISYSKPTGNPVVVNISKIKNFRVLSIYWNVCIGCFFETSVTSEDKNWIENEPILESKWLKYTSEACEHKAYFYEENSNLINSLINKLESLYLVRLEDIKDKERIDQHWKNLNAAIDELKDEGVLIMAFCST